MQPSLCTMTCPQILKALMPQCMRAGGQKGGGEGFYPKPAHFINGILLDVGQPHLQQISCPEPPAVQPSCLLQTWEHLRPECHLHLSFMSTASQLRVNQAPRMLLKMTKKVLESIKSEQKRLVQIRKQGSKKPTTPTASQLHVNCMSMCCR